MILIIIQVGAWIPLCILVRALCIRNWIPYSYPNKFAVFSLPIMQASLVAQKLLYTDYDEGCSLQKERNFCVYNLGASNACISVMHKVKLEIWEKSFSFVKFKKLVYLGEKKLVYQDITISSQLWLIIQFFNFCELPSFLKRFGACSLLFRGNPPTICIFFLRYIIFNQKKKHKKILVLKTRSRYEKI